MKKTNKIKLIFGLGNPGDKFINTPHNFGRDLLVAVSEKKLIYQNNNFQLDRYGDIYLAISKKYMNESGIVLKEILTKFNLKTEETLIIHDEADLPFLWVKLTFNKQASMHKGVESIYQKCGKNIWRLRIGIQGVKRKKADKIILTKLKGNSLISWLKAKKKFKIFLDLINDKDIQKISLPKLFFLD
jgi:PTH1 family peptidyl-tRNA hydrolase